MEKSSHKPKKSLNGGKNTALRCESNLRNTVYNTQYNKTSQLQCGPCLTAGPYLSVVNMLTATSSSIVCSRLWTNLQSGCHSNTHNSSFCSQMLPDSVNYVLPRTTTKYGECGCLTLTASGALNTKGVRRLDNFWLISWCILETVRDMAIVAIEVGQETRPELPNGATSDDFKWPQPPVSRSPYSFKANISQMVHATATVTIELE